MKKYLFLFLFWVEISLSGFSQNTINRYEYWFDNDFANAVTQAAENSSTVNLDKSLSINALEIGLHCFRIRFKDNYGQWSATNSQFFIKLSENENKTTQISTCQYWFDNDFTNAVTQATENSSTVNLDKSLSTDALATGLHCFRIRFKDNYGQWSATNSQFFIKLLENENKTTQISTCQYWFDNDFANAVTQATENSSTVNLDKSLSTDALETGLHCFRIRFKDDYGQWSATNSQFFIKSDFSNTGENNIIAFRYWLNDEFENRVDSIISPTEVFVLDSTITSVPKVTEYSYDSYSLYFDSESQLKIEYQQPCIFNIQFKDSIGQWSSVSSDSFYITNSAPIECDSIIELQINETKKGNLENYYEMDFYKFVALAGDTIILRTYSDNSNFSPQMYFITPDDSIEIITGEKGAAIREERIIQQDGYYKLIICGAASHSSANYYIQVQSSQSISSRINFGEWVDFAIFPGEYYSANVFIPESDNLFVFMKKGNRIGYSATWSGDLKVFRNDTIFLQANDNGKNNGDFSAEIPAPQSGLYSFEILNYDLTGQSSGKIMFSNSPEELELNTWSTGEILRPYGEDWKKIVIPENTTILTLQTEGYGKWSTINVYLDSITNTEKHWKFDNRGAGYQITASINNPPAGTYYIKYIDSAVLYDDSDSDEETQQREYMIYAGTSSSVPSSSKALSIETLSTYTVGKGNASIDITGTGFANSDVVKLVKGNSEYVAETAYKDIRNTVGIFNLASADTGKYELQIINSNNTSAISSKEVTIESEELGELEIEILTSSIIREGRYQPAVITIKNNSGIDLLAVPVSVYLSNGTEIEIEDLSFYSDSLYDLDEANIEDFLFPDTVDYSGNVMDKYDLLVSKLKAYEEYSFTVKMRVEGMKQLNIYVEAGAPIVSDELNSYLGLDPLKSTNLKSTYINSDDCSDVCAESAYNLGVSLLKEIAGLDDIESCALGIYENSINTMTYFATHDEIEINLSTANDVLSGPIETMVDCAIAAGKVTPAGKALKIIKILKNTKQYIDMITAVTDCYDACNPDNPLIPPINLPEPLKFEKDVVTSTTPEDKYGPVGASVSTSDSTAIHYIDTSKVFEYRIDYWNKEDATAPAAIVYIRDTLDTDLNIETLNFTEVGFLGWKVELEGGQYFNVNVDCRPEMDYIVNIEGTVDPDTREVYWVHTTLDPETMELPEDPLSGYLPAIDSTGYQIGWVGYTIKANSGLPDSTVFTNQAFVNFDGVGKWGAAPKEGPYTNIFDLTAPVSSVTELPETTKADTVLVKWQGEDSGCGLITYTIYVSTNGSDYSQWLTTSDTLAWFTGEYGNTYSFYSIAEDAVGNTEQAKTEAEATTTMSDNTGENNIFLEKNIEIKVYPNPSEKGNEINIEINTSESNIKSGHLIVSNISGQVIYSKTQLQQKMTISGLSKGFYLVHVYLTNNYSTTQKIIVK